MGDLREDLARVRELLEGCRSCGRKPAGDAEWKREHDDSECHEEHWCMAFCWENADCTTESADGWPDDLFRDFVEAHAAEIERLTALGEEDATDAHFGHERLDEARERIARLEAALRPFAEAWRGKPRHERTSYEQAVVDALAAEEDTDE